MLRQCRLLLKCQRIDFHPPPLTKKACLSRISWSESKQLFPPLLWPLPEWLFFVNFSTIEWRGKKIWLALNNGCCVLCSVQARWKESGESNRLLDFWFQYPFLISWCALQPYNDRKKYRTRNHVRIPIEFTLTNSTVVLFLAVMSSDEIWSWLMLIQID